MALMCNKCDDMDMERLSFQGSPLEDEAFDFWLVDNPRGTLGEFRESDEWEHAFIEAETSTNHDQEGM